MALEGAYAFDDVGSNTIVDFSGNGRNITLVGTNGVQVTGGKVAGALGKNGATMPVLPGSLLTASQSDDRTIMFDALGARTVWWIRWEKDAIGSGTWGILSLAGTAMSGQARRASDDAPATRPNATAPAVAVWHNYCLTYVRSTGLLTIYYDGTQVDQTSFAAGTQLTTNADRINMAEWSTAGPAIDNLRILSHAYTSIEVTAIAGTPVSGSTAITGTAVSNLGTLTGTAIGTRETTGVCVASLGSLTATAIGTRSLTGTAQASLGALTGTALGTRDLTGTAQASLGGLVGTAIGIRDITAVASADLGALTATATAGVASSGTASADLGALTATVSGIGSVFGTAVAPLDALTATAVGIVSGVSSGIAGLGSLSAIATGVRSGTGLGVAPLGALVAIASGTATDASTAIAQLGPLVAVALSTRGVGGVALADLGRLIAMAIVPNPLPDARLRVSGREPYHYVSGREPRESV